MPRGPSSAPNAAPRSLRRSGSGARSARSSAGGGEFAALARPLLSRGNPWLEAAVAVAEREHSRAAELLATIGSRPLEATMRQRAAEALAAAGRQEEAERELERALEFWRFVGATAYVRAGEALLEAAS